MSARSEKHLPLTDCNYHSMALGAYRGRCTKAATPSFRSISRQYFQKEARHDFVSEAILFAILIITAGVSVVSGAYAILELCRAFGAL
jgi:hypothetical protein